MKRREWILKRNCSLSPRQSMCAFAAPCIAALIVATIFLLHGAWHVFAFAILESVFVALIFIHYARHATDHEHIVLTEESILVERVEANHIQQTWLDRYWARITLPHRPQDLIMLEAKGVKIDVGRFVTKSKRRRFARQLRKALHGPLASAA
jgi:uncharacterized membrane protein